MNFSNSYFITNTTSILNSTVLSFILDFATNASSTTTTTPPYLNSELQNKIEDNSQIPSSPSVSLLQAIPESSRSQTPLGCHLTPATSLLFQFAHFLLLVAYLTPTNVLYLPGACGQLAMHCTLALGHLLLTIWIYSSSSCYRTLFPTLIGWSAAFLLVNAFRAAILLYSQTVRGRLKVKEVAVLYESLFAPVRVSKRDFQKLISKGRLTSLAIGESYAVEGVTETNRLALLVAGKINVMCAGQFLHSINPGEFLDSPEWESSAPPGSSATGTSTSSNNCNGSSKPSGTGGRKPSLSNNFTAVSTAGRYELFDGTTGKTGKEQFQAEVQQRFNISLIAASVNVQYILWERPTLEYHLAKEPYMATVMGLLLARDITNKLYQMNEKFSNERSSQIDIRLPVIINSFSKRTDLTKFLPVSSGSVSGTRPRVLTATVARETSKIVNISKTSTSAAISPLATISTSSTKGRSNDEGHNEFTAVVVNNLSPLATCTFNTNESTNYNIPPVCQQDRESPATTCSTTQTSNSRNSTTEHSSSDEIFIDIGKSPLETPELELKELSIVEPVRKLSENSDEEDEEENSTSASYAAMSLSDISSRNLTGEKKGFGRSMGVHHRSSDSTAVHIPLLPKSVVSDRKHRFY